MRAPDQYEDEAEELIRYATVTEVDLEGGRVVLRSGDVETDQVRWVERRAGKTRSWSPPSVGEQVLLLCPSGEIAGAIAIGGVAQDAFPPVGNSARELTEYEDGAQVGYDPEAHVLDVTLPDGATINVQSTGGVTIDASDGGIFLKGNVVVEGDVQVNGDVRAGDISLIAHKHGQVAAGGAKTGVPE